MKIYNNADTRLSINGINIQPFDTYEGTEMMFDTVYILSDIGSVEIITEYSERHFKCFGQLCADQLEKYDDHGMRIISIGRR